MSEFKGTKGKWGVEENPYYMDVRFGSTVRYGTISLHLYQENLTDISKSDENKANAVLISKAPEMLEMLELLTTYYSADNIEKAKQLIKEATTL